jgi:hypothetical protein
MSSDKIFQLANKPVMSRLIVGDWLKTNGWQTIGVATHDLNQYYRPGFIEILFPNLRHY